MRVLARPAGWGGLTTLVFLVSASGCSFGPKAVCRTRLPYNEAVKTTSEEQLLLNIVRLRYSDNPSSIAVSNIAAQFELAKKLQLVPFFAAAAAGDFGSYEGTVLPGAELDAADRPTLSLTPQDETEFARRLFTPLSLKGTVYLAQTTWPISTVFRLYLENLNWVPNAQNLSGPTPERMVSPPEYEEFQRGIAALRRLQAANQMAILLEEHDERVGGTVPGALVTPRDLVDAAKSDHELKPEDEVDSPDGKEDDKGARPPAKKRDPRTVPWSLTKKKETPYLFISPDAAGSPDWLEFCRVFKVKPGEKKYEIEVTKLTPFPQAYPAKGVNVLDLETRSLLQVLYFLGHGVEVPPEHAGAGLARMTLDQDGSVFDFDRVLGGLFKVWAVKCKHRPPHAAVAVHYLDYWYYIDQRDHDSRATFALVLHMSRLEVGQTAGSAPVLTLPVSTR
jgi:hypothetical protein